MDNKAMAEAIEAMVDKTNVLAVLSALAEVCYLKEDHLISNWQDKEAAKCWHKAGLIIDKSSHKIIDIGYPGIGH